MPDGWNDFGSYLPHGEGDHIWFSRDSLAGVAAMMANRILMGFAIGISSWKLPHLLHGSLIGLFFSLSVSIGFLPADILEFGFYTVAGMFYGLFIEWLATDIIK